MSNRLPAKDKLWLFYISRPRQALHLLDRTNTKERNWFWLYFRKEILQRLVVYNIKTLCNYRKILRFIFLNFYNIVHTYFIELPTKLEREGKYNWIPLNESIVHTFPQWNKRPYFCPTNPNYKTWVVLCEDEWDLVLINILFHISYKLFVTFVVNLNYWNSVYQFLFKGCDSCEGNGLIKLNDESLSVVRAMGVNMQTLIDGLNCGKGGLVAVCRHMWTHVIYLIC